MMALSLLASTLLLARCHLYGVAHGRKTNIIKKMLEMSRTVAAALRRDGWQSGI